MYLENDKLPSKPELLSFESLEAKYAEIRDNAMELAGAVGDVPRRASLLRGIYLETGGRHRFPLLGAHGVLWGHSKFQMAEKFIWNTNANTFMEGLRDVGRNIFIDVYTHYKFSKDFGTHPSASKFVRVELLSVLNKMHESVRHSKPCPPEVLRELFRQSLLWEQEMTVTAGVFEEFEKIGNTTFRSIAKKPMVKFAFFPTRKYLFFRDFTDKEERIEKALQSYDIAEQVGWLYVQARLEHFQIKSIWELDSDYIDFESSSTAVQTN